MKKIFQQLCFYLKPQKLLDSVTLVVMGLVLFLLVSIGLLFSKMIYQIIEKQTEKRALQAARYVALVPSLKEYLLNPHSNEGPPVFIKTIELDTETDLIVITDNKGIQMIHPDSHQKTQKINDPKLFHALELGRPYVTTIQYQGRHMIVGISPVFDVDYSVLGTVRIGYFVETVQKVTDIYQEKELFYIFVFITIGLIAAIYIARGVKKAIFGLEPREIASMFRERTALIESIREGIIATDHNGTITMMNNTAKEYLGKKAIGKNLYEKIPALDIFSLLDTGNKLLDKTIIISGIEMIFNMVPIIHDNDIYGAVATFRKKNEIDIIAKELTQVQTYSDMLRAQTHEYSNRLHTIVGMIQIGAYDEALDFIAQETTEHRLLIRFLIENVPDHALSSLIIGKYMYAMELKINLEVDSESHMTDIPDHINRIHLVTIIGNILENAFEAVVQLKNPEVHFFMTDYGNDLIFEIADNGSGIQMNKVEEIFAKGVSSKAKEKRGYGLYLVKKSLLMLGGSISVYPSDSNGALFVVTIPKKKDNG